MRKPHCHDRPYELLYVRITCSVFGLTVSFLTFSAVTDGAVITFPGGPLPSARAPAAIGYNSVARRAYIVHRGFYNATDVNGDLLPTDRVSVLDTATDIPIALIPLPHSVNGQYQGIALDTARNRVFVTNPDDNSLSIIDGNTNGIIMTIGAGHVPTALALDPALSQIYVANQGGVTVFDSLSGLQMGEIILASGAPRVLAVDPTTHLLYVGSSLSPKLVVVDGHSLLVTGRVASIDGILGGPTGIAVDPGSRVYIAFPGANLVSIVDISTTVAAETSRFAAGDQPNDVAVDVNTHSIYVTSPNDNRIGVYDSSGANLTSIKLRFPTVISIDSASRQAFITCTLSDRLEVLDTSSGTLVNRLVLGTLDFGLSCSPGPARLYAANFAADCVSVLDATNHSYLTNWACGPNPWAVAVDDTQHQLYTLNGDGTVSILNGFDGQLKNSLSVGTNPRAVVLSTKSSRLFVTSDAGLAAIDTVANKVITNIVTGLKAAGIAADEANNRIYVASQLSGQISVLDATTYQVIAKWQPVRSNVWALALDPGLHRLYVTVPPAAFGGFNGLEVLNSDTGEFLAEIPTGGVTISERTAGLVAVDTRLHYAYMTEPDNGLVYVVQDTNLLATVPVGSSPHGLAVDEARGLLFVGNALDGTVSSIDASSFAPFKITQLARQGSQVVVTWNSQPGAFYQLQFKQDPGDLPWKNLGPLRTATSARMSATDSFDASSPVIYRVARPFN